MTANTHNFDVRPEGSETMSPEMMNASRYYEWTVSQFLPYAKNNILDIGGGFGAHLEYILEHFPQVTSVELSDRHVDFMNNRFVDYPDFHAEQVDFGQDDVARLANLGFTTITCFNVLEHIEDDVAALKDMYAILKQQSGTLCLQVPALPWLYGSMDEQAGHYRRYTVSEMKKKLNTVGFNVIKVYYFNVFGVLPWFISARLLQRPLESGSVNLQIKLFNTLVPFFKTVENTVPIPFGQSVMAIATIE